MPHPVVKITQPIAFGGMATRRLRLFGGKGAEHTAPSIVTYSGGGRGFTKTGGGRKLTKSGGGRA